MIIKKERPSEETVIEFEDEEEEDLSWMIQDNEQSETELNNNKKLKRKK